MSRLLCVLLISFIPWLAFCADDDSIPVKNKLSLSGYVKYMQQASFVKRIDAMQTGNLIHNRLHLLYKPNKSIQLRADIRNRIFYGELIRETPGYANVLDNPNDFLNITKIWYDQNGLILHTVIDRAYINYSTHAWDISIGRQRINWGINTVWTPNDIFNTYNFFDFDYEERPGSDGIRLQYAPNNLSAIELAYKAGSKKEEHIGALMYRFNQRNYDFQCFGGILNTDITAGFGWAGNIRNAGFKGETTLLYPVMEKTADTTASALTSISLDYVFSNGLYVNGAFLYNHSGSDQLNALTSFYTTRLTIRNLMPFKYSWSLMINKAINPVWSVSEVLIYSTASNTLISVPSLTYSIADNWELFLTGQLFFATSNSKFGSVGNSIFARLKMAF